MVYGHIYSKSMGQLGKVDNPARGQLMLYDDVCMFCPCAVL